MKRRDFIKMTAGAIASLGLKVPDGQDAEQIKVVHERPSKDEWLATVQVELMMSCGLIDLMDIPAAAEMVIHDGMVFVRVGEDIVELYNSFIYDD